METGTISSFVTKTGTVSPTVTFTSVSLATGTISQTATFSEDLADILKAKAAQRLYRKRGKRAFRKWKPK